MTLKHLRAAIGIRMWGALGAMALAGPALAEVPAAAWVALPPVQYRVLKSGPADGPSPKRGDTITVNYDLHLDSGKLVESSFADGKPATFPLKRLIASWQAVLPLMHVGDEWEVIAPPQFAYGAAGTDGIPPGSTLHFRIQLLAVAPTPPDPAAQ